MALLSRRAGLWVRVAWYSIQQIFNSSRYGLGKSSMFTGKNDKIKYKQSLYWNLEACFLVKTLFRSKDGNRMGIVNRTKRALTRNRDNELI